MKGIIEGMEGKVIDNFFIGHNKDVPEEEVKSIEEIVKRAIVESKKPRCKACVPCSMGIVGCEWDDIPHGHSSAKRCPECGVLYYHIHPHSNICSLATPITDDVRHDEHNMKRQFRDSEIEEKFRKKQK